MGLLTDYGEANRVVDTELTVTYNKRKIYGDWTHTVGAGQDHYYEAWEYSRYARKTYRYVGMTKQCALTCASCLDTYYTRTTKDSRWDYYDDAEFGEPSVGSSILMADISVQHNDGCMWSVVVSVNETDTRLRRASVDPSSLFGAENEREYDSSSVSPHPPE